MQNPMPPEYQDFLDEYGDYLRQGKIVKDGSIRIYTRKLRAFLENRFSPQDLCGAVLSLIQDYARGGPRYNPKDNGSTVAALKHLRNKLFAPLADGFEISFTAGWSSFPPAEKHVSAYTLTKDLLSVEYQKGFSPAGTKTFRVSDDDFYPLLHFLKKNEALLSPSDTVLPSAHLGGETCYSYTLGRKSGTRCAALFDAPEHPKEEAAAREVYRAFLARIEPLAAR